MNRASSIGTERPYIWTRTEWSRIDERTEWSRIAERTEWSGDFPAARMGAAASHEG